MSDSNEVSTEIIVNKTNRNPWMRLILAACFIVFIVTCGFLFLHYNEAGTSSESDPTILSLSSLPPPIPPSKTSSLSNVVHVSPSSPVITFSQKIRANPLITVFTAIGLLILISIIIAVIATFSPIGQISSIPDEEEDVIIGDDTNTEISPESDSNLSTGVILSIVAIACILIVSAVIVAFKYRDRIRTENATHIETMKLAGKVAEALKSYNLKDSYKGELNEQFRRILYALILKMNALEGVKFVVNVIKSAEGEKNPKNPLVLNYRLSQCFNIVPPMNVESLLAKGDLILPALANEKSEELKNFSTSLVEESLPNLEFIRHLYFIRKYYYNHIVPESVSIVDADFPDKSQVSEMEKIPLMINVLSSISNAGQLNLGEMLNIFEQPTPSVETVESS